MERIREGSKSPEMERVKGEVKKSEMEVIRNGKGEGGKEGGKEGRTPVKVRVKRLEGGSTRLQKARKNPSLYGAGTPTPRRKKCPDPGMDQGRIHNYFPIVSNRGSGSSGRTMGSMVQTLKEGFVQSPSRNVYHGSRLGATGGRDPNGRSKGSPCPNPEVSGRDGKVEGKERPQMALERWLRITGRQEIRMRKDQVNEGGSVRGEIKEGSKVGNKDCDTQGKEGEGVQREERKENKRKS